MLEPVALGEEERTLVEQVMALNQSLLSRLADKPTLAGPTPREIQAGKRNRRKVLCRAL